MHTYAFGSHCRGEIDFYSDIDLLIIKESQEIINVDTNHYSIYTYERIKHLWKEGNPFAWHLWKESKMLFASDSKDFLQSLGTPSKYLNVKFDCEKFYFLFHNSLQSLQDNTFSYIYDLSTVFLAIRNFATCYLLGIKNNCQFSRHSALRMGEDSITIAPSTYKILENARLLSTRGIGDIISTNDLTTIENDLATINNWFLRLLKEVKNG